MPPHVQLHLEPLGDNESLLGLLRSHIQKLEPQAPPISSIFCKNRNLVSEDRQELP